MMLIIVGSIEGIAAFTTTLIACSSMCRHHASSSGVSSVSEMGILKSNIPLTLLTLVIYKLS